MDYEALGKRIRTYRKLKKLTQAQLAEKVGVSCAFIGHIERGTRKLSLQTLVSICDEMNVSPDTLLQDSLSTSAAIATTGMSANKLRMLNEIATVVSKYE